MFKWMKVWFGISAAALFGLAAAATPLGELGAAAAAAGESAQVAAERAQTAGGMEAQLLEEFLAWAQGELAAMEETTAEIGALAEMISQDAGRVREIAVAILQGEDEGPKPMAQAALSLAMGKAEEARGAATAARSSLEAAQDRARAIAHSIAAPVAPPPYSQARQRAQTASSLASSAEDSAARARGAAAAGDLNGTVTAAIAALRADAGAWKAACLAEAALRGLAEGIRGWRAEPWAYGRAIAADRSRAFAAAAAVKAVRELLETSVSSGAAEVP